VSYAHADERQLKRALSTHLTILGSRGYIQVWDDRQLIAGEAWEERIMQELEQADLVLLVYSSAARASDFIQKTEAPKALEYAKAKKCTLVLLPLDRSDWDAASKLEQELKQLQTATRNARPVLKYTPQREG
jgi:internalin A